MTIHTAPDRPPRRQHISHGRTLEQRGLDAFDTPVIGLAPMFIHEPLLAGVISVCEPFAGLGNPFQAMRARAAAPIPWS